MTLADQIVTASLAGESDKDIASRLKCHPAYVRAARNRRGLKKAEAPARVPMATIADMARSYYRGATLREIAAIHGISWTGVHYRLVSRGVKLRKSGEKLAKAVRT